MNGRLELLFYAQNEDAGGNICTDGTFYVQAVSDLKNPGQDASFLILLSSAAGGGSWDGNDLQVKDHLEDAIAEAEENPPTTM